MEEKKSEENIEKEEFDSKKETMGTPEEKSPSVEENKPEPTIEPQEEELEIQEAKPLTTSPKSSQTKPKETYTPNITKDKEASFKPIFIVMALSLIIAFFWDSLTFISGPIHAALDPSIGVLLNKSISWGMILVVLIISLITTFVQKYATDQKTLKELKKEQKILQAEMKKYANHPEKLMELQKKSFEFIPKTMKLSMRAMVFTGVPFILLFRWFWDFFNALGECGFYCNKYVGFTGWIIFYILFSIIFSAILRKYMKVV